MADTKLEYFKDRLRESNLKATPQRLAILEILSDTEKHPCADTIYDEIKKVLPGISRATVYSTLRSLHDAGIVQETGGFGAIRRFDGDPKPHPHAICVKCNTVKHLPVMESGLEGPISEISDFAEKNTGFDIIKNSFTCYGICPDCRQYPGAKERTSD